MKLREIREGLQSHFLNGGLMNYMNRPFLHVNYPSLPSAGFDPGSRASSSLSQATGVPKKSRHRRYLGMADRPGTIRLG